MSSIAEFTKDNNSNVRVLSNGYTLSNLQTLLSVADRGGFGVVACNARSKYVLNAILEAAWQAKSPVIIEIAESEAKYCDMAPMKLSDLTHETIERMIAKYGYTVPVCLHHDHIQKDVDGCVDAAIEAGFSSVEVDLSKLPVDENAAKCKAVVEKVHPLGISIEVEEGEIGAAEALSDPDVESNIANYYTKTEDALKLVSETKPDALAFFVGNGHGVYLKTPNIGNDRIKEISDGIRSHGAYSVLHGGTGLSPEMFNEAIKNGARKFNYATALSNIWFEHFPRELLDEIDAKAEEMETARRKVLYIFQDQINGLDHTEGEKAMTDHLVMMMNDAFSSAGKSDLYN
jgi:fructose-bisphosphate aldolase, class II